MWLQSAVAVVFRRDVQFICLPLLYFPWPPLLDVSGEKHQNTAQPEVYLSLNRSFANRLLTAESTYFEKERVACLFCIMVVVSSATGEMTPSHEQVAAFFDARSVSLCC